MYRLVQKFGGTSLADLDAIRHAALRVKEAFLDKQQAQADVKGLVVVSAMGDSTDRLVAQTQAYTSNCQQRDYDVVLASGEQVSSGLMALALCQQNIRACAMQGWQVPIYTDGNHSTARITDIPQKNIVAAWRSYDIIVVPGFQGISPDQHITTLGRGGSDTTAVALAAAVQADICDIYTDVDGIYTADPRVVPSARCLDQITYEEMLELASLGARVLHTRCVELAMARSIPVRLRPTTNNNEGTLLQQEGASMEQPAITGIALEDDEAKITLLGVQDRPGVAAQIFTPISEQHISVDMIVQNVSADKKTTDVTFTVAKKDLASCMKVIKDCPITYSALRTDANVAKVSVVGRGMRSHAGIASKLFATLAAHGINIQVISTSEIKISLLIDQSNGKAAVRHIHKAFIEQ
ncbi:MAG: aspartate kinase [Alphaproteobacteria bacterium GM202ARS2]|nr:aspartate kinase [Alphaproteobacteria bacterium GM202ARS2]